MTDLNIWNDLDSTLSSLDVITSRLAGMQHINDEGDWSVSDTISDASSHDTWYESMKMSGTGSPAFTEDSAVAMSPRSALSEKRSSTSSHSSSVGYHSANHDLSFNGALLSPLSDKSKWTVSSPKSKVHFDELNLVMTKSPTNFELSSGLHDQPDNNNTIFFGNGDKSAKAPVLKGIVKSKTTIPISTSKTYSNISSIRPPGKILMLDSQYLTQSGVHILIVMFVGSSFFVGFDGNKLVDERRCIKRHATAEVG